MYQFPSFPARRYVFASDSWGMNPMRFPDLGDLRVTAC